MLEDFSSNALLLMEEMYSNLVVNVPFLFVLSLKEQFRTSFYNLTVHCCGLEFRVLNGYDQKSFDEERGLNCVAQTSLP
ncbi:hypothetical protein Tco_0837866 [Tanacetum coccineum]